MRCRTFPHHSLFFTRDWEANFASIFGGEPGIPDPASIYVCKPSATDAGVAPPDHENLFVLVPIPADPSLGAGGPDGSGDVLIERTADAAIDQIAQWANIPDLRERVVVRHTIGPADFARDYNSWRGGGMLGPRPHPPAKRDVPGPELVQTCSRPVLRGRYHCTGASVCPCASSAPSWC